MSFLKNIKQLAVRELGIISNDGSILLTVFIAPLLYMFLLGTIYLYKDVDSVDVAVLDQDNSQLSRTFIRFLESSQKVHIKHQVLNYAEAKDYLLNIDVHGVIMIPKGFDGDIRLLKGTHISVYLNNSRFLMSNEINKTVQKIAIMMGAGIRLQYFEEHGARPQDAMEMVMPVQADIRFMNNVFNNYGYFLLPGLLLLILHQTLVIGLGESISLERQEKTLSGLLKYDYGIFTAMIGKNIVYFGLYISYFLLLFSVIFPFFGLPLKGNLPSLILISFLFVISVLLFTNLLSLFFKKQLVYMEILAFTTYPIFLITGYSWPKYALALPYQILADFIPVTPMLEAVVKITQQNAGMEYVQHPIMVLIVQIVIYSGLTYWRYYYLREHESIQENKELSA